MDIEFDHKGDPVGGIITNCKVALFFPKNILIFIFFVSSPQRFAGKGKNIRLILFPFFSFF